MAMEIERRREMADRIRDLRGPKPQPAIANALNVGLRTYQTWEEAAVSPSWENLQALAAHFKVSEDYLLYGEAEPQGPTTQLDRIERKLDELLSRLPSPATQFEQGLQQAAQQAPETTAHTAAKARSARRQAKAR